MKYFLMIILFSAIAKDDFTGVAKRTLLLNIMILSVSIKTFLPCIYPQCSPSDILLQDFPIIIETFKCYFVIVIYLEKKYLFHDCHDIFQILFTNWETSSAFLYSCLLYYRPVYSQCGELLSMIYHHILEVIIYVTRKSISIYILYINK